MTTLLTILNETNRVNYAYFILSGIRNPIVLNFNFTLKKCFFWLVYIDLIFGTYPVMF